MPQQPGADGAEILPFASADDFDTWLQAHAGHTPGVWLKLAKAASGIPSMTSDEAVDVGLCHGWISGQRRALDDDFYLQKYVPRRPRSRWSLVNVRKVEKLTAEGRMRPGGLAEVEAARADGRWDRAYESQAEATVPDDLAAALGTRGLAATFAGLSRTRQYAVILDVVTAVNDTTRARRIDRALAELSADRG